MTSIGPFRSNDRLAVRPRKPEAMQSLLFVLQRWEDEGGALERVLAMPAPEFLGRSPSTTMRNRRIAERLWRKRMERVAWLVGFGLFVLVLLNISGILTAAR
jgi:hypothetical protein